MKRHWKLVIFLSLSLWLFVGCSKKSTDFKSDKKLESGDVEFKNQSGVQVEIDRYTHTRKAESKQKDLNVFLGEGKSFTLENLIDGGASFEGGDVIAIEFRCYYDGAETKNAVAFTVDGNMDVVIIEMCAYNIS
jgi:hypothetical protein